MRDGTGGFAALHHRLLALKPPAWNAQRRDAAVGNTKLALMGQRPKILVQNKRALKARHHQDEARFQRLSSFSTHSPGALPGAAP